MRRREFILALGGATAWSFAARAQQPPKMRRIAIVHPTASVEKLADPVASPYIAAFEVELRHEGYVEGTNLVIERYSAEGVSERVAEVSRNAVRGAPDVIFVIGSGMAEALKDATKTIPIVASVLDSTTLGLSE